MAWHKNARLAQTCPNDATLLNTDADHIDVLNSYDFINSLEMKEIKICAVSFVVQLGLWQSPVDLTPYIICSPSSFTHIMAYIMAGLIMGNKFRLFSPKS